MLTQKEETMLTTDERLATLESRHDVCRTEVRTRLATIDSDLKEIKFDVKGINQGLGDVTGQLKRINGHSQKQEEQGQPKLLVGMMGLTLSLVGLLAVILFYTLGSRDKEASKGDTNANVTHIDMSK